MPAVPVPGTAPVMGLLRAEHAAQHGADVVHDLDELGVEMAKRIGAHRAQRFGIRGRRAGAHQNARRNFNFGYGFDIKIEMAFAIVGALTVR